VCNTFSFPYTAGVGTDVAVFEPTRHITRPWQIYRLPARDQPSHHPTPSSIPLLYKIAHNSTDQHARIIILCTRVERALLYGWWHVSNAYNGVLEMERSGDVRRCGSLTWQYFTVRLARRGSRTCVSRRYKRVRFTEISSTFIVTIRTYFHNSAIDLGSGNRAYVESLLFRTSIVLSFRFFLRYSKNN